VLLKNSIIRSSPSSATAAPPPDCPGASQGEYDDEEEETDSFMFPDAGKLGDSKGVDATASEAEWLDSLLETLGDDGEDEFNVDSDTPITPTTPVDDDEDPLMSPLVSPLVSPSSSSDDLMNAPYCAPPISIPYPVPYTVPYPPFHPPLIRSYELDSIFSPLDSSPLPYDNPLPYHDVDDLDDLAVPDAIEDTSDDESDATIPSVIQSSASSSLVHSTSTPLPEPRRRRPQPHVYINSDEAPYGYPFELDPLPFSEQYDHCPVYLES